MSEKGGLSLRGVAVTTKTAITAETAKAVSKPSQFLGPATTQNLVVKFDGEICGGVLVENASDNFPSKRSSPISPKTSPTSLWKSLLLKFWAELLLDLRAYHWRPGFGADFLGPSRP